MKSPSRIKRSIILLAGAFILSLPAYTFADPPQEDTYDITLIKTAETDASPGAEKEIIEISGRRVLTEIHSVGEGEWIWQILRERQLLESRNLADILDILKKLNPELSNLDRIHPGQKIMIPLTLSPVEGIHASAPRSGPVPVTLEDIEGMELTGYTVQPGDSLIKIINRQYQAPDAAFYDRYLSAVRRLNPSIQDLNRIYPGQVIRLPVYAPELVRVPIETVKVDKPLPRQTLPELDMDLPPQTAVRISPAVETPNPLRDELGRLFQALGEEWIQHGQHFIPLRGQGEVNLRADTYPMIDLRNGFKVIVDLNNTLPGDMASLIERSWSNYRIIHLMEEDDLAAALGRILPEVGLGTVMGTGEAVFLEGLIEVRMTADWILRRGDQTTLITLLEEHTPPTPGPVRAFLARQGARAVDFPPARTGQDALPMAKPVLDSGPGLSSLVETLLDLNRLSYLRNVEIPVFENRESKDFNLFVTADYLLEKGGQKLIMSLSGVGSDIMTLLKDRELSYLSLAGENDPLKVLSRFLEFLGIPFDPGPLEVMAADRSEHHNVRFRIPGASFRDGAGRSILATTVDIPEEVRRLLTEKGFHVLRLSPV